MSIESQFQDDDVITEPQVEETDTEPDYVSDDFVQVEPVGNPFPNPRFIDAMYGELLSRYRETQFLANDDHQELWDWNYERPGAKDLLNDYLEALSDACTCGGILSAETLSEEEYLVALSESPHVVKLLAIGQLLAGKSTEKQWARAYALYDYARKQRRRVWDVPDDEEVEAA